MKKSIEQIEKLIERTPTGELRDKLTEINIFLYSEESSERHLKLKRIAQELSSMAEMPYCWEDIVYRLSKGHKLPFKINL